MKIFLCARDTRWMYAMGWLCWCQWILCSPYQEWKVETRKPTMEKNGLMIIFFGLIADEIFFVKFFFSVSCLRLNNVSARASLLSVSLLTTKSTLYSTHNHILKNEMNTLKNIRNGISLLISIRVSFSLLYFLFFVPCSLLIFMSNGREQLKRTIFFSFAHHQHLAYCERHFFVDAAFSLSFFIYKLNFSCAVLRYVDPLYCMNFLMFAVCLTSMDDAVTWSVVDFLWIFFCHALLAMVVTREAYLILFCACGNFVTVTQVKRKRKSVSPILW